MSEEIVLQGLAISEGVARGTLFFLCTDERKIPEFSIGSNEVEGAIARYRSALFSSREDLKQIQQHLPETSHAILDSHICMLEDPLLVEQTEARIRICLQNPASAFQSVIHDYAKRFSQKTTPFLQERLADVKDLAQRVLGHLTPSSGAPLAQISSPCIVFAQELLPSQIVAVDPSCICGFVTTSAGGSSHAALIARSKGIPYVGGVDLTSWISSGVQSVIVDGDRGTVILNPSAQTVQDYQLQRPRAVEPIPCGVQPIQIYANSQSAHPAGIGLFRSEYLCMQNTPSEEEQYAVYAELMHSMQGKLVVIRLLDLGADKTPHWMPSSPHRGIAFLLHHPELLRVQLRALLRAAVHGDLRLLLPFVSDRTQIDAFKQHRDEVSAALSQEGIPHRASVPLGCMIELPSAVFLCDSLAKQCDFFSIGTNDLIQQTLGIDRAYNPSSAHPSIFRMIHHVAQQDLPLTLCGEMASDPLYLPLLMGLGVLQFSCAPRYIPLLKCVAQRTSLSDARALADLVLTLETAQEVTHAVSSFSGRTTEESG